MSKRVLVDFTHTGRDVTGIERVAIDLFSNDERYELIYAKSKMEMVYKQWIYIPLLSLRPSVAAIVCPGFPPSVMLALMARKKVTHYVHDLFLAKKSDFLSAVGRYYMAPSFRFSLKRVNQFFVNSLVTAGELNAYVRKEASVKVVRPPVNNVFNIDPVTTELSGLKSLDSIKIVTIGTVEPRKGLLAAVLLCEELQRLSNKPVVLEVFGRQGWGKDWDILSNKENVVLYGYTGIEKIQTALANATFYLASSTEEGLGLPLLEVQHGGVTVIARDIAVFAEVLGTSGLLIDFDDVTASSIRILNYLEENSPASRQASAAQNVARWNRLALNDQHHLFDTIFEAKSRGEVL